MRWLCLLSLLAGCDSLWRLNHLDPLDAQPPLVDSDYKPIDAGPCAGTLVGYAGGKGLIQICIPAPPPKLDFEFPDGFDTATDCDVMLNQADGTSLCVVTAQTITLSLNADVKGPNPLVLAASDSVSVNAHLNVAARAAGDMGPGSNYMNCRAAPGGAATTFGGGGGGGGGSFATHGGAGGPSAAGGVGGATNVPTLSLDRIRAGCGGGDGGPTIAHSGQAGNGGSSGGAVYIVAGGHIDLTGSINASGAGGHGGDQAPPLASSFGGGGGGGGSGGLIALDAPTIIAAGTAVLLANGGGGGSGGGEGVAANDGGDPNLMTPTQPAPGGAMVLGGAAGGTGGVLAIVGKPGGSASKTGGGGGGGVGYIAFYTRDAAPPVTASPAVRVNP